MKVWDRIKQVFQKAQERSAQMEVVEFVSEYGYFSENFPKNLKKRKDRQAYKQNLTETYTYQEGDDLLAKKQDFIDQYTINEREQFDHFITNNLYDYSDEIKARVWRNHEQIERNQAQRAWRTVVKRNYHTHMRQNFMNQKTK